MQQEFIPRLSHSHRCCRQSCVSLPPPPPSSPPLLAACPPSAFHFASTYPVPLVTLKNKVHTHNYSEGLHRDGRTLNDERFGERERYREGEAVIAFLVSKHRQAARRSTQHCLSPHRFSFFSPQLRECQMAECLQQRAIGLSLFFGRSQSKTDIFPSNELCLNSLTFNCSDLY